MGIDKYLSLAETDERRSRAEDHLKVKVTESSCTHVDAETKRLLYELQVHQIELEMQNAELRQARNEVESSLEMYAELYDFAPVGYFTLDRSGNICTVNLSGAGLLGIERSRLLRRHFGLFVREDCRPGFADFLETVFTCKSRLLCEVALLNEGQRPNFVQIEAAATASGQGCRIALMDISARKQAEEALQKSEELYRGLVEQMGAGLGCADSSFVMTFANNRFLEILGLTVDQVIGRSLTTLFGDRNHKILLEQIGIRRGGDISTYDLSITRNDGTRSYLVIKGTPLFDQAGQFSGSIAVLDDVTDRMAAELDLRNSHERLRHLSAHMETTREDERLMISREVHDELGQSLTALKFDVAYLRKQDSFAPKLALKLASMEETVDTTIGSVQRIVAQLRPRLLDDLGLEAAIEWQARDFAERTGIACRLELCEAPVLVPECSIAVIRILQEALTNIMRHAKATEVTIMLAREEDGLAFTITDNGIGFRPPEPGFAETFGLLGMNERAVLCGGTLAISSTQGVGTVLRLRIPLKKARS